MVLVNPFKPVENYTALDFPKVTFVLIQQAAFNLLQNLRDIANIEQGQYFSDVLQVSNKCPVGIYMFNVSVSIVNFEQVNADRVS